MSGARTALLRLLAAVRRAPQTMAAATRRRADARTRAICPVDSWAFRPLYTGGTCPLCGWTPEAYVYRPPLLAPYERFWGALGGIAAISVVMCIVVVVASSQA